MSARNRSVAIAPAASAGAVFVSLYAIVQWLGMDIKAPFDAYDTVTGIPGSGARALESLRLLVASGVEYECRTTAHPALLPREALFELAHSLAGLGVRHYVLQEFRPQGCADAQLSGQSLTGYLGEDLTAHIAPLFSRFAVRRT
jgi:pyruvate-formate lyase-activating enzyme